MRRLLPLLAVLALAACQQPQDAAQAPDAAPAAAPDPVMPADAPPQEEAPAEVAAPASPAAATGCAAEVGRAAADRLVQRCIAVTPATHPPCNTLNPCEMIRAEIERSCEIYGPGQTPPPECAA